jgi:hypothetical protein
MSLIAIVTAIPDFHLPEKQRVQKQAWHNLRIITDNCNLIDVPTLRRSFKNMKRRG